MKTLDGEIAELVYRRQPRLSVTLKNDRVIAVE